MGALILSLGFVLLVLIDGKILLSTWRCARNRRSLMAAAAWKAAGTALVFSPGLVIGGDGCLPIPASVGLILSLRVLGGARWVSEVICLSSLVIVFLVGASVFWFTTRRERAARIDGQ